MELEAAIARSNANKQRSALLRLPAELRNVIYEHLAEESETTITVDRGIILASAPACVCRQLRAEFLPFVTAKDRILHITVTDFNFEHVIAAHPKIWRLYNLASNPSSKLPAAKLHMTLHFTDYFTTRENMESRRWALAFSQVPITIYYKVTNTSNLEGLDGGSDLEFIIKTLLLFHRAESYGVVNLGPRVDQAMRDIRFAIVEQREQWETI
jgi:hypothetical protein